MTARGAGSDSRPSRISCCISPNPIRATPLQRPADAADPRFAGGSHGCFTGASKPRVLALSHGGYNGEGAPRSGGLAAITARLRRRWRLVWITRCESCRPSPLADSLTTSAESVPCRIQCTPNDRPGGTSHTTDSRSRAHAGEIGTNLVLLKVRSPTDPEPRYRGLQVHSRSAPAPCGSPLASDGRRRPVTIG